MGRDSTAAWSVQIDVPAVLLTFAGHWRLWLLLHVHRGGLGGLVVSLIGLLVMLLVVWLSVP
jgi:hypothetical protein